MTNHAELIARLKASAHPSQWELIREIEAALQAMEKLGVTNILLEVVPGDGSGHEVYAKSVDDVERMLTKLGDDSDQLHHLKAMERKPMTEDEARQLWVDANASWLAAENDNPYLVYCRGIEKHHGIQPNVKGE